MTTLILTPQQLALSVIEQFSYCPFIELHIHNDSGWSSIKLLTFQ